MLSSDVRPRRLDTLRAKDLGDEFMFYDAAGDAVHVLNGTAREVYLLCDGRRRIEDIVRAVVERYEVDEATARGDVGEVIERLLGLGVLGLA